MQTNRLIQHNALALIALFVAALVPWLFVLRTRHDASSLVAGICVAGILAIGGTALDRMNTQPRHIPAHSSVRPVRGHGPHPA